MLFVGLVFVAVGMISFFAAFGGSGQPKYFWCTFVGMPLSFVGMVLCKFAFMGSVARYAAGELAPVGADTFNYVAKETQEGVAEVSEAIFEGKAQAEANNVEERLKKLADLRQAGLIDADDYEEQKDRILTEL